MKLFKGLIVIAIVSLIAISCNDTKKGAEKDLEEAVETVEDATDEAVDATKEADAAKEVTKPVSNSAKSTEKAIETEVKGVNVEGLLIETKAETPVIYPGCEGTQEEIRACSRKRFKKFLVNNFDSDLANEINMEKGDHKIRAIIKINAGGKASVIRVDATKEVLEKEVVRLIDKLPVMTAATKGGVPVDVYFVLPIDYKVID